MERWKNERYPAIRAAAEQAGVTIYFADEAGIRSDYHSGTTWAPIGRTPVVHGTGARFAINMISAVTAKGALRFAVYEGSTTAATFIDFCKRLLHDAPGPVYLIVETADRWPPSGREPAWRSAADHCHPLEGRRRSSCSPCAVPKLTARHLVWTFA
ncbi:MAG: transposase [Actinoallomurus sp.]